MRRPLVNIFNVRIEDHNAFYDHQVYAPTLVDARKKAQELYNSFHSWTWFGAVAFVCGKRKAEDVALDRVRAYSGTE